MKRKLIQLIGSVIIIGGIQSTVIAQGLKDASLHKSDLLAYAETMFNQENGAGFSASTPDAVNIRVIRNFKKEFTAVENETWSMMNNGCYIVRFTRKDIQHRVEYNQKGHWLSTTKFYTQQYLSHNVREQVMSTYYNYKIFCVAEVTVGNRSAYYITLEDESTWLKIRLMGEKMEELEVYKKG